MTCTPCQERGKMIVAAWEAIKVGDWDTYNKKVGEIAESTKLSFAQVKEKLTFEALEQYFSRKQ